MCMSLVLLLAAIYDARSGKIPNWVVAIGIMIGGSKAILTGGIQGNLFYISRLLEIFVPFYICYYLRLIGAGDVKLITVIYSYMGTRQDGLMVIMISFVFAAFFSLPAVVIGIHKRKKDSLRIPVRLGPAFFMGWLAYLGGIVFV